MEHLVTALSEYGAVLVEPVATFVAAAVLYYTRKWFKITADEKMRNALNQAIENGLRAAGQKVVSDLRDAAAGIEFKNPIVNRTIEYVARYSPGAMKHFGLSPERLEELVVARLPKFVEARD